MSMARATCANNTLSSPFTKATFSARSLKIVSSRGSRPAQEESSSLILILSFVHICTTMVFCQHLLILRLIRRRRLRHQRVQPLGVVGLITMKMISSTSKISISGTTFISATVAAFISTY